jgi:putative zinc finger/helix-turn-helix YgiT family protein
MNCFECNTKMKETKPTRYRYVESGLDNLYLKGITVWECPECGSKEIEIPDPSGLQRVIAHGLVSKKAMLTGKEFRFLRTHLGHSSEDMAHRLGVTRETISRWENSSIKITGPADLAARQMVLLNAKNHDYKIVDLVQIIESRRRLRELEIKFNKHWQMKSPKTS